LQKLPAYRAVPLYEKGNVFIDGTIRFMLSKYLSMKYLGDRGIIMKTFLIFEHKHEKKIPKEFQSDDNRFPESLVRFFLNEYTEKGDKIIDPFAGLGTTLIVSEELGRIPYGIELDAKRASYIKSQIKNKNNLINGDSLKVDSYTLPKFDFCFTSPPYTYETDEDDAFSGYAKKGNYNQYLKDVHSIFSQLKQVMKKNSHVVIEVSNHRDRDVTVLAWDIAREVSKVFHFEGETVIGWEGNDKGLGTYDYGGYDHSYCLIFKNK
jgi:DNA modification methylase